MQWALAQMTFPCPTRSGGAQAVGFELGSMDMGMGTCTTLWLEQYLKNYNITRQVRHRCDIGMTQVQHSK